MLINKIKIAFYILLFTIASSVFADSHTDARRMLKKWGMAYCLRGYKDGAFANDAGGAEGGYFQIGAHNDDAAYQVVRRYFDYSLWKYTNVIKETGMRNLLMACINLYETPDYNELIKNQDVYLN